MTQRPTEKLNTFSMPLNEVSMIEANAGAGKTYTIVNLYLRLILQLGTPNLDRALLPKEILVVTFTRDATAEMAERIEKKIIEFKEYLIYLRNQLEVKLLSLSPEQQQLIQEQRRQLLQAHQQQLLAAYQQSTGLTQLSFTDRRQAQDQANDRQYQSDDYFNWLGEFPTQALEALAARFKINDQFYLDCLTQILRNGWLDSSIAIMDRIQATGEYQVSTIDSFIKQIIETYSLSFMNSEFELEDENNELIIRSFQDVLADEFSQKGLEGVFHQSPFFGEKMSEELASKLIDRLDISEEAKNYAKRNTKDEKHLSHLTNLGKYFSTKEKEGNFRTDENIINFITDILRNYTFADIARMAALVGLRPTPVSKVKFSGDPIVAEQEEKYYFPINAGDLQRQQCAEVLKHLEDILQNRSLNDADKVAELVEKLRKRFAEQDYSFSYAEVGDIFAVQKLTNQWMMFFVLKTFQRYQSLLQRYQSNTFAKQTLSVFEMLHQGDFSGEVSKETLPLIIAQAEELGDAGNDVEKQLDLFFTQLYRKSKAHPEAQSPEILARLRATTTIFPNTEPLTEAEFKLALKLGISSINPRIVRSYFSKIAHKQLRSEISTDVDTDVDTNTELNAKVNPTTTSEANADSSSESDLSLKFAKPLAPEILALVEQRTLDNNLILEIRKRYPFAIIDEFQDTNSVQFAIFKKLFIDGHPHYNGHQPTPSIGFVMIGDPKQSIYRFRGAEIFGYFAAKETAQRLYSIDYNYRSTADLITSYNQMFSSRGDAFSMPQISYTRSLIPEAKLETLKTNHQRQFAANHFQTLDALPTSENGSSLSTSRKFPDIPSLQTYGYQQIQADSNKDSFNQVLEFLAAEPFTSWERHLERIKISLYPFGEKFEEEDSVVFSLKRTRGEVYLQRLTKLLALALHKVTEQLTSEASQQVSNVDSSTNPGNTKALAFIQQLEAQGFSSSNLLHWLSQVHGQDSLIKALASLSNVERTSFNLVVKELLTPLYTDGISYLGQKVSALSWFNLMHMGVRALGYDNLHEKLRELHPAIASYQKPGSVSTASFDVIASYIVQLVRSFIELGVGNLLYLGEKALRPADICILEKRNDELKAFQEEFKKYDIRTSLKSENEILEHRYFNGLKYFLTAVTNPDDTNAIRQYLFSMLSGLSNLQIQELLQNNEKYGAFKRRLDNYLVIWKKLGLLKLIQTLIEDNKLLAYAQTSKTHYQVEVQNIFTIIDFVIENCDNPNDPLTCVSFLNNIKTLMATKKLRESNIEDPDAVKLMTMHGSKGLEFGVVLSASIGYSANSYISSKSITIEKNSYLPGFANFYPWIGKWPKMLQQELENADILRQFYVTITRAKYGFYGFLNLYTISSQISVGMDNEKFYPHKANEESGNLFNEVVEEKLLSYKSSWEQKLQLPDAREFTSQINTENLPINLSYELAYQDDKYSKKLVNTKIYYFFPSPILQHLEKQSEVHKLKPNTDASDLDAKLLSLVEKLKEKQNKGYESATKELNKFEADTYYLNPHGVNELISPDRSEAQKQNYLKAISYKPVMRINPTAPETADDLFFDCQYWIMHPHKFAEFIKDLSKLNQSLSQLKDLIAKGEKLAQQTSQTTVAENNQVGYASSTSVKPTLETELLRAETSQRLSSNIASQLVQKANRVKLATPVTELESSKLSTKSKTRVADELSCPGELNYRPDLVNAEGDEEYFYVGTPSKLDDISISWGSFSSFRRDIEKVANVSFPKDSNIRKALEGYRNQQQNNDDSKASRSGSKSGSKTKPRPGNDSLNYALHDFAGEVNPSDSDIRQWAEFNEQAGLVVGSKWNTEFDAEIFALFNDFKLHADYQDYLASQEQLDSELNGYDSEETQADPSSATPISVDLSSADFSQPEPTYTIADLARMGNQSPEELAQLHQEHLQQNPEGYDKQSYWSHEDYSQANFNTQVSISGQAEVDVRNLAQSKIIGAISREQLEQLEPQAREHEQEQKQEQEQSQLAGSSTEQESAELDNNLNATDVVTSNVVTDGKVDGQEGDKLDVDAEDDDFSTAHQPTRKNRSTFLQTVQRIPIFLSQRKHQEEVKEEELDEDDIDDEISESQLQRRDELDTIITHNQYLVDNQKVTPQDSASTDSANHPLSADNPSSEKPATENSANDNSSTDDNLILVVDAEASNLAEPKSDNLDSSSAASSSTSALADLQAVAFAKLEVNPDLPKSLSELVSLIRESFADFNITNTEKVLTKLPSGVEFGTDIHNCLEYYDPTLTKYDGWKIKVDHEIDKYNREQKFAIWSLLCSTIDYPIFPAKLHFSELNLNDLSNLPERKKQAEKLLASIYPNLGQAKIAQMAHAYIERNQLPMLATRDADNEIAAETDPVKVINQTGVEYFKLSNTNFQRLNEWKFRLESPNKADSSALDSVATQDEGSVSGSLSQETEDILKDKHRSSTAKSGLTLGKSSDKSPDAKAQHASVPRTGEPSGKMSLTRKKDPTYEEQAPVRKRLTFKKSGENISSEAKQGFARSYSAEEVKHLIIDDFSSSLNYFQKFMLTLYQHQVLNLPASLNTDGKKSDYRSSFNNSEIRHAVYLYEKYLSNNGKNLDLKDDLELNLRLIEFVRTNVAKTANDKNLRGAIDFIGFYENNIIVMDYKTNNLGNKLANYVPSQMANSMQKSGYIVQTYLYLSITYCYLRQQFMQVVDTPEEARKLLRDLNFYGLNLYLRGLLSDSDGYRYHTGTYIEIPTHELIEELADTLTPALSFVNK